MDSENQPDILLILYQFSKENSSKPDSSLNRIFIPVRKRFGLDGVHCIEGNINKTDVFLCNQLIETAY